LEPEKRGVPGINSYKSTVNKLSAKNVLYQMIKIHLIYLNFAQTYGQMNGFRNKNFGYYFIFGQNLV
jgi:hypothetical protein